MEKEKTTDAERQARLTLFTLKATALHELIMQRHQLLVIVSTVALAGIGVVSTSPYLKNRNLAMVAALILLIVLLVSLIKYTYITRVEIKDMGQQVQDVPKFTFGQSRDTSPERKDYWVEGLVALLVLAIVIGALSFFC